MASKITLKIIILNLIKWLCISKRCYSLSYCLLW